MKVTRRQLFGFTPGLAFTPMIPTWFTKVLAWFEPKKPYSAAAEHCKAALSTRVFVPTFEIASMPAIPLDAIKERRFVLTGLDELDWHPMLLQQAESRIHRYGQPSKKMVMSWVDPRKNI